MENDKAVAAYAAQIELIKMRLDAIANWSLAFGEVSPDDVQWPNVGSAWYVAENLGEIMEFLQLKTGG